MLCGLRFELTMPNLKGYASTSPEIQRVDQNGDSPKDRNAKASQEET